jgi:hypothetical protein
MMSIKRYWLLIFILFSCNDNIDLKEDDLKKYNWLTPFIAEKTNEFEGKHNVGLSTLEFNYTTLIKSTNELFAKNDSVAKKEGWVIVSTDKRKRQYSKKLHQYPADTANTVIEINIDTVKSKLFFSIK